MTHLRFYIMIIATAAFAYYLGGLNDKPEPVWDCYKALWGDVNAMRVHGLQGLSAQEVHAYCVEMTTRGEPTLMVLSNTYSEPLGQVEERECPPCVCVEIDHDEGCMDNAFLEEEIKP